VEHHRVQLHGGLVEVFLWDRTELHRRAWAGGGQRREKPGVRRTEHLGRSASR